AVFQEIFDDLRVALRQLDEANAEPGRHVAAFGILARPADFADGANGLRVTGDVDDDVEQVPLWSSDVRRHEEAAGGQVLGETGVKVVVARHRYVEIDAESWCPTPIVRRRRIRLATERCFVPGWACAAGCGARC